MLRRLIRRMALHLCLQLTNCHDIDDLMAAIVAVVMREHGDTYTNIKTIDSAMVVSVLVDEVRAFLSTVDKGRQKLHTLMKKSS